MSLLTFTKDVKKEKLKLLFEFFDEKLLKLIQMKNIKSIIEGTVHDNSNLMNIYNITKELHKNNKFDLNNIELNVELFTLCCLEYHTSKKLIKIIKDKKKFIKYEPNEKKILEKIQNLNKNDKKQKEIEYFTPKVLKILSKNKFSFKEITNKVKKKYKKNITRGVLLSILNNNEKINKKKNKNSYVYWVNEQSSHDSEDSDIEIDETSKDDLSDLEISFH